VFKITAILNQYQQDWITCGSTREALTHEKYLFLAKAGPYRTVPASLAPMALSSKRDHTFATAIAIPNPSVPASARGPEF
jgi:hypothetical protein